MAAHERTPPCTLRMGLLPSQMEGEVMAPPGLSTAGKAAVTSTGQSDAVAGGLAFGQTGSASAFSDTACAVGGGDDISRLLEQNQRQLQLMMELAQPPERTPLPPKQQQRPFLLGGRLGGDASTSAAALPGPAASAGSGKAAGVAERLPPAARASGTRAARAQLPRGPRAASLDSSAAESPSSQGTNGGGGGSSSGARTSYGRRSARSRRARRPAAGSSDSLEAQAPREDDLCNRYGQDLSPGAARRVALRFELANLQQAAAGDGKVSTWKWQKRAVYEACTRECWCGCASSPHILARSNFNPLLRPVALPAS